MTRINQSACIAQATGQGQYLIAKPATRWVHQNTNVCKTYPSRDYTQNSSIDKKLHTMLRFQRKHSLDRHHYLEVVLSVLQSQKVEASSLLQSLGTHREAPWLIHLSSSLATTISNFPLRSRGRKQTYPLPNTLLYVYGTPVLDF